MIDIKDRVKNAALQGKIVTAYEAAQMINHNDKVGISGFTPSGYAKAVPLALAERMEKEPFKIDLWTGASVGDEADGALTRAHGINRRFPYQTNGDTRKALNSGDIKYVDMHLSTMAQNVRYGFFGDLDVAIVEVCQINEDGSLVPTTSVGNSPTFVSQAKKVIVEVNVSQPLSLVGMHDIYEPLDPPYRKPIPLEHAGDRIGTDAIPCDPDKIIAVVPCDVPDTTRPLAPIDDDAKAVPLALAERMEKEPFKIDLWTGASVGDEADGALTRANGINRRFPYQTNGDTRKALNSGAVKYIDMHLSTMAQNVRYGFFGDLDVAIIEAAQINEDGSIVPTTSVGNSPTFVSQAKKVIVEVNVSQPLSLVGMHDIYEPLDPPHRKPIPLETPGDRIGTEAIPCDPSKIVAVVPCDVPDTTRPLAPIDDDAKAMSQHLIKFFEQEIAEGRLPKNLLPLQSGVGSVANAVISGLAKGPFTDLSIYTEVIQDGMFDLIDAGKVTVCSGTALSPSPDGLKRFYANIDEYRKKIILRPQEISNNPGIARRIGVIAMNTAIEFDIFGNVNSTHIMGSKMMNGVGGSGDFARSAYLTIFCTNSVAKNGDISSIVPYVSHVDHPEHDTMIFCTEQGVADCRGLSPVERARLIIEKCAHPDYKPMLTEYLEKALAATKNAHTPMLLDEALSWHKRFTETGSMKK